MENCDYNKKAIDYNNENADELPCIKEAIKKKKENIESMINTNLNVSELNKNTKTIYVDNFYYVYIKSIIFIILGYLYYMLLV
mgnify:CR=1 FL=1